VSQSICFLGGKIYGFLLYVQGGFKGDIRVDAHGQEKRFDTDKHFLLYIVCVVQLMDYVILVFF